MEKFICLDTETTGLSVDSGHKVIEIGAIELVNYTKTGNKFQHYLNPDRAVDKGAFMVHGISNEMLKDKPRFKEIAQEFLSFIEGSTLVIHNAKFDIGFLNAELEFAGFSSLDSFEVIDTIKLAKKKIPNAKYSLDDLCRRFSIDISSRQKHGALLDSDLLADLFVELCGQKQQNMAFDAHGKMILEDSADKQKSHSKKRLEPRVFNFEELQKEHEEFMKKNVKNSIWKIDDENCN